MIDRIFFVPALIMLLLFVHGLPVVAAENSDMGEMAELLSILEEETEVATKTKMNADYVPGIVTVYHGEDLEAMGARTVWEALGFVPGVNININETGRPMVVVRGVSGTNFTGHLKLMVNSAGANPSFRGTNDPLMMIPMEQVARIEVIRGPGSALYGEFAYTGVVNIITRKDGNRLYGSAAKYDTYGMGGLYSNEGRENGLKVSINASGWETDGADVNSGTDSVELRFGPGFSYSPGPTNEDEKVRSLALNMEYKKSALSFYGVQRKFGGYFGLGVLTPDSDGTPNEEKYWYLDGRQSLDMANTFKGVLKVAISENESTEESLLLPPGVTPPGPLPLTFTDGHRKITYVKERRMEGGGDFTWTGWEKHTWLLRLSAAEVEIKDAWEASNFTDIPVPTFYPSVQRLPEDQDMWIDEGKKRKILSAVLQDQYDFSEAFTLTAAARYDDFDDVGSKVTPRLAGVWKAAEGHLFKFQYAEAYRPPNLAELYLPETGPGAHGNPRLDPETSKNYEVGYIYRRPGTVGRLTLFYTLMKDLIVEQAAGTPMHHPGNSDEVELKGAEIELEKKLGDRWKGAANLSLLSAYDKTHHHDVADSVNAMGNIMLEGRISDNLMGVVNYRYVGDRLRGPGDPRDDLDAYETIDVTLNRFNLLLRGLTIRAGVKNVFDEEVKAPSVNYQDDLPRPGRTWWMQLSREF